MLKLGREHEYRPSYYFIIETVLLVETYSKPFWESLQ